MTDTLTANRKLTFDPTRLAHLSSRVGGTVATVLKTIGDEVHSGDVLALIDAAQVGEAKPTSPPQRRPAARLHFRFTHKLALI